MSSYERKRWHRILKRAETQGIPLDPRWRNFHEFLKDVGPRPAGHFLVRDYQGPFAKGSLRWRPSRQLLEGAGAFRVLTYESETKTVGEWSEQTGISVGHISQRLSRRWPTAAILGFAPPPSAKDRTYVAWRCLNAQKTVPVSTRWKGQYGYWNFLEDMGEKPEGFHLTRLDLSKGFNPHNCVYLTHSQVRTLHAKKYTVSGKTLTLKGWADKTGVPIHNLASRLRKGLSMQAAIKSGKKAKRFGKRMPSTEERTKTLWHNLKSRLNQPLNPCYKSWGAKGFRLCDRWRDFNAFLQDMGPRPERASICIKPGCKVFNKKNCYYGTQAEVLNMSRRNKITYRGKTRTITEWANELGLPFSTLYQRLVIMGWSIPESFGLKPRRRDTSTPTVKNGWGGLKIAL